MELEDLKSSWASLEEQLKRQELLNENIMREVLHTKSDKALSRLLNSEVLGIIVILLVFPVIIYGLGLHKSIPFYSIFMYAMLGVCILILLWQLVKLYNLTRIDFSKTLRNNVEYTNKYNIKIKKEKFVMWFFVPALVISVTYLYAEINVPASIWAFMICGLICAIIFTFWSYKKIYDKNIASILKSLEELKELEELEEE